MAEGCEQSKRKAESSDMEEDVEFAKVLKKSKRKGVGKKLAGSQSKEDRDWAETSTDTNLGGLSMQEAVRGVMLHPIINTMVQAPIIGISFCVQVHV